MSELEPLTVRNKELVMQFRDLTKRDGLEVFSSDDFRTYGLDKHFTNKKHTIGGVFAKMVLAKNPLHRIRRVGYKQSEWTSNNKREIKTYEWLIKP